MMLLQGMLRRVETSAGLAHVLSSIVITHVLFQINFYLETFFTNVACEQSFIQMFFHDVIQQTMFVLNLVVAVVAVISLFVDYQIVIFKMQFKILFSVKILRTNVALE